MHGVPQSETQGEPDHYPPILRFSRFPLEMPDSERRFLLFMGDTLVLLSGAFLAQYWQGLLEPHVRHSDYQDVWLAILAVAWLLGAAINECYTLQRSQRRFNAVRQVCVATFEAGLIYLVVFFFVGRPAIMPATSTTTYPLFLRLNPPPRLLPVFFMIATLPLLTGWRLVYIDLLCSRLWRHRVLIVGAGRAGCALVEAIQRTSHDYEIVGFIDDDPAKQGVRLQGVLVLGTHQELLQLVDRYRVSEVVLAITNDIDKGVSRVLMQCYEQGVCIHAMALVYEETLERIPVEHLGKKWFPGPLHRGLPTFYRACKRVVDITLALVGMVLLGVLLIPVAPAIYLESRGPIFYRQERLGRGGKRFRLLKFRTMKLQAEHGGGVVWATAGDVRVTRVGRLLRPTRLDELPQVLMVLKGDMSIVGPRPERPEFVRHLEEQIPFYRTRLSVKPGLTGWAQINYHYGSTVEDAAIKLQYDLYYIKHRSMLLDLLIMLRTIHVMLALGGI